MDQKQEILKYVFRIKQKEKQMNISNKIYYVAYIMYLFEAIHSGRSYFNLQFSKYSPHKTCFT